MRALVLGVMMLLLWAGGAPAQVKEALVIGNAGYATGVGPLANPRKDAALIGRSLEQAGFKVRVVGDLGRTAMLKEVREYGQRLRAGGPSAIGFFYYSGHGVANPADSRNYLIPVDVQSTASDTVWDESVPLEEVTRQLTTAAPGADQIIVFDACRDELRLPFRSGAKGLARVPDVGGVLVAFSTSPEAKAADGKPTDGSGPYAAVLAEELAGAGRDASTLFEDVKYGVLQRTGNVQLPWTSNGLRRRVFLNGARQAGVSSGPAVAAATTDRSAVEVAFWSEIKDSDDPGLFKDYLERVNRTELPGLFRAVASARLAALTKPAAPQTSSPSRAELDPKWGFMAYLVGKTFLAVDPSGRIAPILSWSIDGDVLRRTSGRQVDEFRRTGPGRYAHSSRDKNKCLMETTYTLEPESMRTHDVIDCGMNSRITTESTYSLNELGEIKVVGTAKAASLPRIFTHDYALLLDSPENRTRATREWNAMMAAAR